jgi:hypothetical protein
LKKFFIENRFQFGDEMSTKIEPGRAVTALKECLKSYYETYSADTRQPVNYFYKIISGTQELPDKSNVFVDPDLACSHEYLIRYYSSIFFGQLFLELFIVDLLDRISPLICRGQFKNTELLTQLNLSNESHVPEKTVGFKKVLQRLKIVIDDSNLKKKYDFLKNYEFISKHYETLDLMRELRNDIVHSGQKILYHYSYEVLFINHFLPIVKNFVRAESNTTPINRNLHCRLNILDELCRFPLPESYLAPAVYDQLKELLHRINHFKELGRASLLNPLFMGEWGNDNLKARMFEHNRFQKNIYETQARLISQSQNEVHICPCCGSSALIPVEFSDYGQPLKVTCHLCSYNIEDYIGEPNRFNITEECIFKKSEINIQET